MKYEREAYLGLFLLAFTGLCYLVTNILRKEKNTSRKFDHYIDKAYLEEERGFYYKALEYFKLCLSESQTAKQLIASYNGIGIIYFRLNNYTSSIGWLTKALNLEPVNAMALDFRSLCYEALEKYKEAFIDIALLDVFRKDKSDVNISKRMDEMKRMYLKKYSITETTLFMKNTLLNYSNIRFFEFFSKLEKIIPEGETDTEDLAYILEHKEYNRLCNFFFSESSNTLKEKFIKKYGVHGLFTYDLILWSIYFIREEYVYCLDILKEPKTEIESIMLEYTKLLDNSSYDTEIFGKFDKFIHKSHPTIRFWIAMCYKEKGMFNNYINILNDIKHKNFSAYREILSYHASNEDIISFIEAKIEAFEMCGDDLNIIFECCDFYFKKKNSDNLFVVASKINRENDAYFFQMGRFYVLINDVPNAIHFLQTAIDEDPTNFESYISLADIFNFIDFEKCKKYAQDALKIATRRGDVFYCFKKLLIIELIEELRDRKYNPYR